MLLIGLQKKDPMVIPKIWECRDAEEASDQIQFLFFFDILFAAPTACGSFWAWDQTLAQQWPELPQWQPQILNLLWLRDAALQTSKAQPLLLCTTPLVDRTSRYHPFSCKWAFHLFPSFCDQKSSCHEFFPSCLLMCQCVHVWDGPLNTHKHLNNFLSFTSPSPLGLISLPLDLNWCSKEPGHT